MSWVTLDHGNSSLKWCLWTEDEFGQFILQRRGSLSGSSASKEWAELLERPVEGALYCGVVGAERAGEVRDAWAAMAPDSSWSEPQASLSNECEPPELVGRDRLMAALGAHSELEAEVIIVDAGTALTVDALKPGADGEAPRFLGGAIAPGPAVLAAALGDAGAQLFEAAPSSEVCALGRSTEASLAAGVSVGFAGAAARLVKEVSQETGLEEAPVVITGGARAFLTRPGLFGPRELRVYLDLVHGGLLAAAGIDFELEEEMWASA